MCKLKTITDRPTSFDPMLANLQERCDYCGKNIEEINCVVHVGAELDEYFADQDVHTLTVMGVRRLPDDRCLVTARRQAF